MEKEEEKVQIIYSHYPHNAHKWVDKRSFNFRLQCHCKFQTKIHLMEKDAVAELNEHRTEVNAKEEMR